MDRLSKERIQQMLLVCKQNAMPVLCKMGKCSVVVLCGVLRCMAAVIQLLLCAVTRIFAKYMGLSLRTRMIVGAVAALGIVALIALSKYSNHSESDPRTLRMCPSSNANVLSQYAGTLPKSRVDNSRMPYSNNALSQYAGTTRESSAISQTQGGYQSQVPVHSGSNPYAGSGSFVGYSPNDLSAEYLGTYNPYYEPYQPNGSFFGGGNPYGNWNPNTNMVQSIDPNRMWKIYRNVSRYYTRKRLSDLETENAVLEAENKMREYDRQLGELKIDRITGTTKAQRDEASDNNLEQIHPNGPFSIWGGNGDPELHKDRSSGDIYRVQRDGTRYRVYNDGTELRMN